MSNYADTVAGFVLQLYTDRPDLIQFGLDIDRKGTLTERWEFVESNHLDGDLSNLRLVGLANLPAPPQTAGIPPQPGGVPLVKFFVHVLDIPESAGDRTARIIIEHGSLVDFEFADPAGKAIGTIQDSVLDTAYWHCLVWNEDSTECLEWEWLEEPLPGNDSMIVYWRPYSYLDTTVVHISDGTVTVTGGYHCGDIDGSGTGPDIADLVYLVSYMFGGGPPPPALPAADCTGDGPVDVSDLVCFVQFMFAHGPAPECAG